MFVFPVIVIEYWVIGSASGSANSSSLIDPVMAAQFGSCPRGFGALLDVGLAFDFARNGNTKDNFCFISPL